MGSDILAILCPLPVDHTHARAHALRLNTPVDYSGALPENNPLRLSLSFVSAASVVEDLAVQQAQQK